MNISKWIVNLLYHNRKAAAAVIAVLFILSAANLTRNNIYYPGDTPEILNLYLTIDSNIPLLNERQINTLTSVRKDMLQSVPEIEFSISFLDYINNGETAENANTIGIAEEVPDYLLSEDGKQALVLFSCTDVPSDKSMENIVSLYNSAKYRGFENIEHFKLFVSGEPFIRYIEKKFFETDVLYLTMFLVLVMVLGASFMSGSFVKGAVSSVVFVVVSSGFLFFFHSRMSVYDYMIALFSFAVTGVWVSVCFNTMYTRKFTVTDDKKGSTVYALHRTGVTAVMWPVLLGVMFLSLAVTGIMSTGVSAAAALSMIPAALCAVSSLVLISLMGHNVRKYKGTLLPDKQRFDAAVVFPVVLAEKVSAVFVIAAVISAAVFLPRLKNIDADFDYGTQMVPFLNKLAEINAVSTGASYTCEIEIDTNTEDTKQGVIYKELNKLQQNETVKAIIPFDHPGSAHDKKTSRYVILLDSLSSSLPESVDAAAAGIQRQLGNHVTGKVENRSEIERAAVLREKVLAAAAIVICLSFLFTFLNSGSLLFAAENIYALVPLIVSLGMFGNNGKQLSLYAVTMYPIFLLLSLVGIKSFGRHLRYNLEHNDFSGALKYTAKTERTVFIILTLVFGLSTGGYIFSVHSSFDSMSRVFFMSSCVLLLYQIVFVPAYFALFRKKYSTKKTSQSDRIIMGLSGRIKIEDTVESDTKKFAFDRNEFTKNTILMGAFLLLVFFLMFSSGTLYEKYKRLVPSDIQKELTKEHEGRIKHTFTIHEPTAEEVRLAGEFNFWNNNPEDTIILKKKGDGTHQITLYLGGGQWLYRFMVDGKWTVDPENPLRASAELSRFNSILRLGTQVPESVYKESSAHGSIEKYGIHDKNLKVPQQYLIYLPPDYSVENEYPVLFALHNAGLPPEIWIEAVQIQNYMDNLLDEERIEPFIIVMPDGGYSMYTGDTETFIIKKLYPHLKQKYSIAEQKNKTAITGFSSGGFGAIHLAYNNQQVFGLSIPVSMAADFADGVAGGKNYYKVNFPEKFHFQLIMYCGLEDERGYNKNNLYFSQHLDEMKIPYKYNLIKSEGHNVDGHNIRFLRSIMTDVLIQTSGFFEKKE